jgi:hypothetical protein
MQVRDAAGKAERQKMRCMHAYITDIVSMILAGTLYRFTSPPSQRTCVSLLCPQTLKNGTIGYIIHWSAVEKSSKKDYFHP